MSKIRVHRIKIRNYRGIEALEQEIPAAGIIAKGANTKGKTTFLKAFAAALAARDVAPDAIRIGATEAEILIDLGDLTVSRLINQKGHTVKVENKAGFNAPKPQTLLNDLLGTSPLDPLELFLAKPKDRRNKILEAMPVVVTREQMLEWAPDLPKDFDTSGHGLEVIGRAHELYYETRKAANKTAADAKAAMDAAEARLAIQRPATAELARSTVSAAILDAEGHENYVLRSVPEAEKNLRDTEDKIGALRQRGEQAEKSEALSADARANIKKLRDEADGLAKQDLSVADSQPLEDVLATKRADVVKLTQSIERLQETLQLAKVAVLDAEYNLTDLANGNKSKVATQGKIDDLRKRADEQEKTVETLKVAAPSPEELTAAESNRTKAAVCLEASKAAVALNLAETELEKLKADAETASARAAHLDKIVKTLHGTAPSQALATVKAIPGLTVNKEDVFVDGVNIEQLSGAEMMYFALDIGKRLNDKSRFLVVDGLERLDPENEILFVQAATKDGWQLIGSKVTSGGLVLGAIELAEEEVPAS